MDKFTEIKGLILDLESDIEKFYEKGNKAAGTRIRKSMQDIKALAQDIRTQVQGMKNEVADKAPRSSRARKKK
jgi:predicted  nucleic acid-binding Zn-ribbon protein